ncbi:MAG: putative pyrophosphatase or phosphodiesterase, AlkP superfamily [Betaproteobacteria bacterium]|nr:putative pyrophosphatase or phosphodiesterase, AlkP superfamily [Betaproteobacteria bacterium]
MRRFAQLFRIIALTLAAGGALAQAPAALQLVFVIDGLRPDSITEANTPTLYRLRREGVAFENTHSVFPTVTRVNSTSLATGMYPARHGIMGNSIYVPAVDPKRAFTNDDFQPLLKLEEATGGRMVTVTGIAEILAQSGRSMVAVSSGSTGSAILLAPKAPRGTGTVINGDFFPGTQVAWPKAVSDTVLQRFGAAPKKGGATTAYSSSVDWSMQVLRDYVLPELKPAVVFTWMTEPDHIQHGLGAGAPESVEAIRNDDRQLGLVLQKLEALGLRDKTNIIVVSDHGFAQTVFNVNVSRALIDAGLISAAGSDEVVIASSGQAVALHVKNSDPARINSVVEFLQRQPWCGVVFTKAKKGGAAHEGTAAGTFALEYAHLGGHERSPDIVFTFPWSSAPNRHGTRGTEHAQVSGDGKTGTYEGTGASHGGIGPWTVRNTMLAWGPGFKRGTVIRTPTSNVDVTPTLLHLLGLTSATSAMDGRVMLEALAAGPDEEQVATEIRSWRVRNGAYSAILQTSETGGKRYIDKAWRELP